MNQDQLRAALIAAGVNKYIIEFDEGRKGDPKGILEGCHINFDDLPDNSQIAKLVKACGIITDKGIFFEVKR